MQHIVNIAFDFDDEKVKNVAENKVENEMSSIIKQIVTERIAPLERQFGMYRGEPVHNWDKFDRRVNGIIREFMETNKEEIIERAANKLAESYKRTKAWKEQAQVTCYE